MQLNVRADAFFNSLYVRTTMPQQYTYYILAKNELIFCVLLLSLCFIFAVLLLNIWAAAATTMTTTTSRSFHI